MVPEDYSNYRKAGKGHGVIASFAPARSLSMSALIVPMLSKVGKLSFHFVSSLSGTLIVLLSLAYLHPYDFRPHLIISNLVRWLFVHTNNDL